jgi:hypothetical protein
MSIKHSVAALAAISLLVNSAGAATVFVQAAAGHPHLGSGTHVWADEWTDTIFRINDGRSISLLQNLTSNGLGPASRTWDTPIPLTATNQNWNVIAFATTGLVGTSFTNRICTFNSSGVFSSCGASVAAGSTSTALVPTDGSAYSQSVLNRNCQVSPPMCSSPEFHHIKASN